VSGLWASQWKLTRLPPWELGVMTEVQDSKTPTRTNATFLAVEPRLYQCFTKGKTLVTPRISVNGSPAGGCGLALEQRQRMEAALAQAGYGTVLHLRMGHEFDGIGRL
jgi:hypothetical protein